MHICGCPEGCHARCGHGRLGIHTGSDTEDGMVGCSHRFIVIIHRYRYRHQVGRESAVPCVRSDQDPDTFDRADIPDLLHTELFPT